jgi:ABC-2 type transport system permease protein
LLCVSLGLLMGAMLTINQVSGMGSLLIVMIALFSGAWTPLKMMGGIFEGIGYALPFAHAVDATRSLLAGASLVSILYNFYFVLIYTVLLFSLSIFAFKRTMKKG